MKVIKSVYRGFIMRFMKEEIFDQELYLWPKGVEAVDGDAIPFYIDYGDGKPLREFYNHQTHPTLDVYCVEPYEVESPKVEDTKANKFKEKFNKAFNKPC